MDSGLGLTRGFVPKYFVTCAALPLPLLVRKPDTRSSSVYIVQGRRRQYIMVWPLHITGTYLRNCHRGRDMFDIPQSAAATNNL